MQTVTFSPLIVLKTLKRSLGHRTAQFTFVTLLHFSDKFLISATAWTARAETLRTSFPKRSHFCSLRCVVKSIDPGSDNSEPFVTLANEEKIKADAIIGADGIRSITREVVTGAKDRPIDTGDAAYRYV